MNKQEILEKAIQKAIESGWLVFGYKSEYESAELTHDVISGMPTVRLSVKHKGRIFGYRGIPLLNIIFNHDFAKALWGEDAGYDQGSGLGELYGWQYHLQQMVIADDPIQYLGEHI